VLQTICWKAPGENPAALSILRSFRAAGVTVEAVMEPSGTYGDVLRYQLEQDWYQRKKQRDGGRASRAAVALMRKMAKGLYHVGRGGTFDSSKLFDTRRLQVVT
jgi:hypothetical protein